MSYTVLLEHKAESELKKLRDAALRRVDLKIQSLRENPRPKGVIKLKGKEQEGWRIRVGNYRILYLIDDDKKEIRIYRIKHRQEAYHK